MGDLLALAQRCEDARGSDLLLGREVLLACGQGYVSPLNHWRNPTGSIEAAMELLPAGWDHMELYAPDHQTLGWTVIIKRNANFNGPTWEGFGQTRALAMTAAMLRTRQTLLIGDPTPAERSE